MLFEVERFSIDFPPGLSQHIVNEYPRFGLRMLLIMFDSY